MPSTSVIIPTFNRRDMLVKALDSVAAQTYRDFEIIVVDDGSTDGTDQLFARGRFENLTYLRQSNRGPSAARNAAASMATSEYLAFLDDDDEFLPTKLELQIRALEQHPDWGLVAGGW